MLSSRWFLSALLLTSSLAALPLAAQQQTGNLFVRVVDSGGKPLAGIEVTLTGQGAPLSKVSDAEGAVRFPGLPAGLYQIKAEGVSYQPLEHRNLVVQVSRSLEVEIKLLNAFEVSSAQTLEETLVVTGESPLLDARMVTKGTDRTRLELEKLPTTRDPWAILQQTPGVLLDRINVGGHESGRQARVVSPGTDPRNTVWQIDGVAITDMVGAGSSSTYYDFDTFEAVEVSVGGADAALATAGATVNLVTKRGTNQGRFSARYFVADNDWQATQSIPTGDLGRPGPWNGDNAQQDFKQGNRIVTVQDYGIEGGGPLKKDHLWGWASLGRQRIDLLTVSDFKDNTDVENGAAKLSFQASPSTSGSFFYHFGNNIRIGQDAGPFRPPETSVDRDSPTGIYKLESSHVFSDRFYLSGTASQVETDFELLPQGGGIGDPTAPNVVQDTDGGWRNSFLYFDSHRPQREVKVEGSYYFSVKNTTHELRFGTGYRSTDIESVSTWPGLEVVGLANIEIAPDTYLGFSTTGSNYRDRIETNSYFLQDTLTAGNLTANLGVRYDYQRGKNLEIHIEPSPLARDVLVGGDFAEANPGFDWKSISPRLGLTYALGKDRQTLLRASYAEFADQLDDSGIFTMSPGNPQYGYFYWYDTNADLDLTAEEIGPFFSFAGVDPDNPGRRTVNEVDPGLVAPVTEELLLAVEHALRPELVLGLSLTARRYTKIEENELLVIDPDTPEGSLGRPHRREDYVPGWTLTGTLPNGSPFSVPAYRLRPGVTSFGGVRRENGDREQEYLGASLVVHKRLSDGWLLRGHFTWSDWTWKVPDSENEDPTVRVPVNAIDGAPVLIGGSGQLKANVFVNSGWSYDVSGLYQLAPNRPWGLNVAANLFGREGYPVPYSVTFTPRDGRGRRTVLVSDEVDQFRFPDVHMLSLRLEKEIPLKSFKLAVSLDAFNVTNERVVLQRAFAVAATQVPGNVTPSQSLTANGSTFVTEVLPPRILRLGVRLSFR